MSTLPTVSADAEAGAEAEAAAAANSACSEVLMDIPNASPPSLPRLPGRRNECVDSAIEARLSERRCAVLHVLGTGG
jgi:hypothetical protein